MALLLVFAQVAHAFDACGAHLENARSQTMIVKAPCVAGVCDCTLAPVEDVCATVSELAVRPLSGAHLSAPPTIIVDAPFVAAPIPVLETPDISPFERAASDVPLPRPLYLAPQLAGRAPPSTV